MIRTVLAFTVAVTGLSLTGCEEKATTPTTPPANSQPVPTTPPPAPGTPAPSAG